MLWAIAAIILFVWIFYKIWIIPYDYWKKRGFPYLEATFPGASSFGLSFMTQFQGQGIIDVYNKIKDHPYAGIIILRRPHLFVKDLEFVKKVMVKDFDYFRDRTTAENIQEPISEHLFNLPGEKWRVKRVNLGPIFSAGKAKSIFLLFNHIKDDFFSMMDKLATDKTDFDGKDTMSRFTIDFIGSWAFGTRVDSLKKPEHVMHETGPKMFPAVLNNSVRAKQCFFNFFSFLDDVVQFPLIPPDFAEAVDLYVHKSMDQREKNETQPLTVDFIDTLLKMKRKGTLTSDRIILSDGPTKKVSENKVDLVFHDLSAEALILFAAGFDTSSTTIACTLFELAWNQEIQERLVQEIQETTERYGEITYQALHEMTYLDQVISETLRKYPPVPVLTRKCTRDYQMPDRPELVVERGTRVIVPLLAIHMDPELFPDPEKFDPDRFSPENKDSILPYSYMPFGEGPRYCIGKRMGLLQAKMGVALTVSRYKVLTTHQTQKKIKFEPTLLVLTSKTPIWLKVEKREA